MKKNPTFLTLRKLDVAKDIAAIIAKSQSKVYLPADILLLNNLGITSTTQLVSTHGNHTFRSDADSFFEQDRERAHKQWVHEFELVCM